MKDYHVLLISEQILDHLDGESLKTAFIRIEKHIIEKTLKICKFNCQDAAEQLGMNRTTLVEKRRRFGLKLREPLGSKKTYVRELC